MASSISVSMVSNQHPSANRLKSTGNDGPTDVIVSGAIITAICGLLAVLSVVFFVFTWRPIKHRASFHIQSWTLFFCAEWLFATLLTFDYFFSSRSAQIIINLNGRPVSPSVIQHLAHILNFTHAYQATYFRALFLVLTLRRGHAVALIFPIS